MVVPPGTLEVNDPGILFLQRASNDEARRDPAAGRWGMNRRRHVLTLMSRTVNSRSITTPLRLPKPPPESVFGLRGLSIDAGIMKISWVYGSL
jgi:hypothetical protein